MCWRTQLTIGNERFINKGRVQQTWRGMQSENLVPLIEKQTMKTSSLKGILLALKDIEKNDSIELQSTNKQTNSSGMENNFYTAM